ncbi:SDR family oxidoreductase [Aliifodinibius sp. S!AR15-10]|uniref:SDR family oxidoreductase n=1 Tax=Aliifodinibius sp. S!AR15-10 TaxID=2950437 RepID=UPI00285673B2|nr:SDR family oxidoreductase [Aliifodinibius sp. S!AR15-10]MDR8390714.1 SDR family oxidoreductase [Aliifodinibius sp. S!AR15-10]
MKLSSRKAIVTGAGSGLGAAIATALTRQDVHVFGLGRTKKKLSAVQNTAEGPFTPVSIDITDRAAVSGWVSETFFRDSAPDILVNNAGAGYFAQVDELAPEHWEEMVRTNLNGMFYLTREIVPLMKQHSGSTHIINVGSILSTVGNPKQSGYCATKFGIAGFSEALFKELRYDGIKVTCLNPGSIETDFFEESGIRPHDSMLQPADIANTVIHLLQTPDNFLVSDLTIRPLNPRRGD